MREYAVGQDFPRVVFIASLVLVLAPYGVLGFLNMVGACPGSAWTWAPLIANAGVLAASAILCAGSLRRGDARVRTVIVAVVALCAVHAILALAAGRGAALTLAALRYVMLPAILLAATSGLLSVASRRTGTAVCAWLGCGSLLMYLLAEMSMTAPFPPEFFAAKGYDDEVMRTYVLDMVLPRFGGVLGDPVNLSLAAGGCAAIGIWRLLHRDGSGPGAVLCFALLAAIVVSLGKGGPVLLALALAAMWAIGRIRVSWAVSVPCLIVAGWLTVFAKVAVMDAMVRSALPSAGAHATSILSIGSSGDPLAFLVGHGVGTSGAFSVILGGLPYAQSVARGGESAVASMFWQLGLLGMMAMLAAAASAAAVLERRGPVAIPFAGVAVALLIQGMIQENAFAATVWFPPLVLAAAGVVAGPPTAADKMGSAQPRGAER